MSLKGQRIAVIGGTSGIGFAVAKAALAEGAELVVGSSNPQNVEAAVGRLGGGASGHAVDVKSEADVEAFFAKVGALDHLVFTAGDWGGFRNARPLTDTDLIEARGGFDVRFWGALTAVKHALPRLARTGSIVLTNGTVAHRPQKGRPISTAMAGSLEHLTRALAVDLAPIRVNAVCPAGIRTDVWKSVPEDRLAEMTRRQPLPRIGEPEEVAEAYLYAMRGGYTTGQVLLVDGGTTIV
ncbi:MAG TPA: SDR family oxidoreductase [Caulobacteraceae bacterium]|nr:SDR family oxidoreductase [Caulobacteraceae bacterium]